MNMLCVISQALCLIYYKTIASESLYRDRFSEVVAEVENTTFLWYYV